MVRQQLDSILESATLYLYTKTSARLIRIEQKNQSKNS